MSHPTRVSVFMLAAMVVLGVLGGCAMASMAARTDAGLLRLVERLVQTDRAGAMMSVGIVAAAAIVAAIVIPAVTVYAVTRLERRENRSDNANYLQASGPNRCLPDPQWLDADPTLGRDHDRRAADRAGRELPVRTGHSRRSHGLELPGYDPSQGR